MYIPYVQLRPSFTKTGEFDCLSWTFWILQYLGFAGRQWQKTSKSAGSSKKRLLGREKFQFGITLLSWQFLMKIYDQFLMTIYDDNLGWQFLMTIFDGSGGKRYYYWEKKEFQFGIILLSTLSHSAKHREESETKICHRRNCFQNERKKYISYTIYNYILVFLVNL